MTLVAQAVQNRFLKGLFQIKPQIFQNRPQKLNGLDHQYDVLDQPWTCGGGYVAIGQEGTTHPRQHAQTETEIGTDTDTDTETKTHLPSRYARQQPDRAYLKGT